MNVSASKEEQVFSALFEKYYNRIYSNAFRLLKVRALAEDVSQQVFLKVWEHRSELVEVRQPQAWLFQIAKNMIADIFRQKAVEQKYTDFVRELIESNLPNSPEDLMINAQRSDLMKRGLEMLSPKQKQVYTLSRNEGKTYEEIAGILDIGKDTVKEYMQIALSKLRQYFHDHRDELIVLLLFCGIV